MSGKVIDENGNPVAYANVIFAKTTIGAYTDDQGRFSLYSEKRQKDLEVSLIGYNTIPYCKVFGRIKKSVDCKTLRRISLKNIVQRNWG